MGIQTREIIKCYGCGREIQTSEMLDTEPWIKLEVHSELFGQDARSIRGSGTSLAETFCSPSCVSYHITCKLYNEQILPSLQRSAPEWLTALKEKEHTALEKLKQ